MFGPPPADYVPTPAERDLRARWVASPDQHAAAAVLLAEHPDLDHVYVPIALPGKDHGIWEEGQPVEYPEGVFVDRDDASRAAALHLGTRPGQPSYAVIWRPGSAAVFEDFRGLFPDDPIRD